MLHSRHPDISHYLSPRLNSFVLESYVFLALYHPFNRFPRKSTLKVIFLVSHRFSKLLYSTTCIFYNFTCRILDQKSLPSSELFEAYLPFLYTSNYHWIIWLYSDFLVFPMWYFIIAGSLSDFFLIFRNFMMLYHVVFSVSVFYQCIRMHYQCIWVLWI